MSRIRSTLEFGAPVFHSGLTKEQSTAIELMQKKAFAIILGKEYGTYESALSRLNLERLDSRRLEICYNFALKAASSTRHKHMFPLNPTQRSGNRHHKTYLEYQCRTSRYFKSPLPFMARLLNNRCQNTL